MQLWFKTTKLWLLSSLQRCRCWWDYSSQNWTLWELSFSYVPSLQWSPCFSDTLARQSGSMRTYPTKCYKTYTRIIRLTGSKTTKPAWCSSAENGSEAASGSNHCVWLCAQFPTGTATSQSRHSMWMIKHRELLSTIWRVTSYWCSCLFAYFSWWELCLITTYTRTFTPKSSAKVLVLVLASDLPTSACLRQTLYG
jgi:hypothetical protein